MNPKIPAKQKTEEWKLKNQVMCVECGEIKVHKAKGMCLQVFSLALFFNTIKLPNRKRDKYKR